MSGRPVVAWTHEDGTQFIADDVREFLRALASDRLSFDGRPVVAPRSLIRPQADVSPITWPRGWPAALTRSLRFDAAERELTEQLETLCLGTELDAVFRASEALEARYADLGWEYHLHHTRFQRRRFFR